MLFCTRAQSKNGRLNEITPLPTGLSPTSRTFEALLDKEAPNVNVGNQLFSVAVSVLNWLCKR